MKPTVLLLAALLTATMLAPIAAAQEPPFTTRPCIDAEGNPGTGVYFGEEELYCGPGPEGVPDPTGELPPNPLDSVPTVTVTSSDGDISESGDRDGTFAISIADDGSPLTETVTVKFTLTGSATKGDDYTLGLTPNDDGVYSASGAPGSVVNVKVTAKSDTVEDEDEDVILELIEEAAYNVGTADTAELVIEDVAAPVVSIASLDATMTEGSANDPTASFTVAIEGGELATPLDIELVVTGTAAVSDYAPAVDTIFTIPAGEVARTFDLVVFHPDHTVEGMETLIVTLKQGGSTGYLAKTGAGAVTINIVDADVPSVDIAVSQDEGVAAEDGDDGPVPGAIVVTRNVQTPQDLEVLVAFTGSTAATNDYTREVNGEALPVSGTNFKVIIPAGETSAAIDVTPVDDSLTEGTEYVNVTLVPAANNAYQLPANKFASLAVLDSEVPSITVAVNKTIVSEGGSEAQRKVFVNFTRTSLGTDPVLNVTVVPSGSAVFGTDYVVKDTATTPVTQALTSGALKVRFDAGQLKETLVLTLSQDTSPEFTESIVFTVQAAPTTPASALKWGVGVPAKAEIAVVGDDDPGTPVPPGGTTVPDTDGDGDRDNADNCLNAPNADQANADRDALGDACDDDDDNDGLLDSDEGPNSAAKTDPKVADTDADGRSDRQEVKVDLTDPRDRYSPDFRATNIEVKSDGNGVQVTWNAPAGSLAKRYLVFRNSTTTLLGEVAAAGKTSYSFVDAKYDGEEHVYHVQAMLPSQSGSAFDAKTAGAASAPFKMEVCEASTKDTDGDGLCDQAEVVVHDSDPLKADTDGDGFSDKAEVDAGSDVKDPSMTPKTVAGNEVSLATEGPFWIGLVLVIATLVAVVAGIGMARRRTAGAAEEPYQP